MRLSLLQKLDNAHEDSVWTAAWAPGSNLLITGSVDETAKVWEGQETLEQRHIFVSRLFVCVCVLCRDHRGIGW